MVSAGGAIGLGNIWRFPYLAYRGGGAIFIVTYLAIVFLLAHPMVEAETAIGRHGGADTVSAFECIHHKWQFVGWIANICTLMICFYYVVVGGWVLRYAVQFCFVGNFGVNHNEFFQSFISNPIQPLIYDFILLGAVLFVLFFGITAAVEKLSKIMTPTFFVLLLLCGVYSITSTENAVLGLRYYLLPKFDNFTVKVFAEAVTQVLFSVGIGWGVYTTLGANLSQDNNIRKDSLIISYLDTLAALLAGFVIIPAAYGAGVDVQKGPALIFDVMAGIFANLRYGRLIGSMFFIALVITVLSSFFCIFEITVRTLEIRLKMGRKKAILISAVVIGLSNVLISLGFGPLKNVKLPWLSFSGIEWYGLYDWLDCFTGYLLLPLGCLLTSFFVWKIWGWDEYERELTHNGRDGRLTIWNKAVIVFLVPTFMIIVLMNVFGLIQ